MTDEQAAQLVEMRKKGVGYKSIATVLGLSRDIVRNYCRTHNLTGYASALTKNVQMLIENGEACPYCGGMIHKGVRGRPKRFCSEKCRRAWWKAHPEAVRTDTAAHAEKECLRCGKSFISYERSNRKYCCHDCYIKDRFWKEEKDVISEV